MLKVQFRSQVRYFDAPLRVEAALSDFLRETLDATCTEFGCFELRKRKFVQMVEDMFFDLCAELT